MNELALFAGAGGGILAGHSLGWRTVCAVEWEPYAASVLAQRQNDGILAPFPIWDDVRTFDGRAWRGVVDVVSGGFPCTDISAAGRGAGIEGEHSGLWREMARIIGEVLPSFVFVENSPLLVGRGAAMVIGDLTKMGYDAEWCCLSASDIGAPHQRDRFWLVAYSNMYIRGDAHGGKRANKKQHEFGECGALLSNASGKGLEGAYGNKELPRWIQCEPPELHQENNAGWWATEPPVGRVVDGMAARVDRLKALGNGQVPRVASTAWRILTRNA